MFKHKRNNKYNLNMWEFWIDNLLLYIASTEFIDTENQKNIKYKNDHFL